jgi:hypothetical protein
MSEDGVGEAAVDRLRAKPRAVGIVGEGGGDPALRDRPCVVERGPSDRPPGAAHHVPVRVVGVLAGVARERGVVDPRDGVRPRSVRLQVAVLADVALVGQVPDRVIVEVLDFGDRSLGALRQSREYARPSPWIAGSRSVTLPSAPAFIALRVVAGRLAMSKPILVRGGRYCDGSR